MIVSACVRVCERERTGERKRDFHTEEKVEDVEIVCHFFSTLLFVIFICSMSSGVLVLVLL